MALLRFIFCLFIFIGLLATASAFVLVIILMLRFPPLLIAVALACGMFVVVLRKIGIRISIRQ